MYSRAVNGSIRNSCVLFLLSAIFFGCQFEPVPIGYRDVPRAPLREAQQQILDKGCEGDGNALVESENWFGEEWWYLFNDPQLEQFIETALAQNPSIFAAQARIEIAAAERSVARAPLFPSVDGQADSMQIHNSKNGIFGLFPQFPLTYRQTEMSLSFAYEFDFWRKHYNELRVATNEVLVSEAQAYLTQLTLALSVADAYYQRQAAALRDNLAKQLLQNREELALLTQQRQLHGLDTELTLNRTLSAARTLKQYERSLALTLASDNNALQALLADDFSVYVAPANIEDAIVEPFPVPATLPIDLLAHRADIWVLRWRAESAARKICIAKANFYPNINLTGFIGLQTIHPHLFQSKSLYGSYGPAIHLPIFEGGALQGAYDVSKAEYLVAIADYESAVLDAVKDVLNALAIVQTTADKYRDALAIENLFQSNLELTKRLFKQNVNSRLEVLVSEYDWMQAKDNRFQMLLDCLQARLLLIRALGGGFHIPCEGVVDTQCIQEQTE